MKAPVATGLLGDVVKWVQNLIRLPQPRKVYTVATLPTAADFDGATVPVSDGSGGLPTVTSVNGSWIYPNGVAA
jgi:hypothetical protein